MNRYISRPATRRGIVIAGIIAMITVIATRDIKQDLQPRLQEVDTRLNYALFDFKGQILDEQGQLAMTIEAPVLRNNATSGIGAVTRPEVYVRENGNQWRMRASTAVISADRQFVSLAGDVSIVRYNAQDSDALEIQTRDLVLDVNSRSGNTDARVSMKHALDQLWADGMFLDLVNDQFELHDNVKAIYDTP
ncbi:MAG TPA: LPS export ABC transporter periplasmic protein LptC [Xanthomonadales bacterium]|nr:LPS export ABC transporter periplasmic protein LptC [Xanthomonadales bacterium]